MSTPRLPDFYVLGAMKAATTTLAAQLGAQDGIFMADPKEPNFFSDDDIFARGQGWYEKLFEAAGSGDLIGEASTHYTKWPDLPDAPGRLKVATPDVKFIYMIRHPVERARSHAFHMIRKRHEAATIDEVAAAEPALWQYGCYAAQLERWLEHFPADRFLIVSMERMSAEPETEFARVLRHLGATGTWSEELAQMHSAQMGYKVMPLEGGLMKLPLVRAMRRTLIPRRVKRAFRRARAINTDQRFSPDIIHMIEEKIAPDLARLGEMCGVEMSLETYKDVVMREHLTLMSG